jgi:hypothetical protein
MQSAARTATPSEDELLRAFEALTLDPALFTHRRHLAFGWRYLQRLGFPEGAARFVEVLKAYVQHVGATGKYHETITWAYLVLLNEELVLRSNRDEPFESLVGRRPDLLDHRNGALAAIYSKEQLDRPEARRAFLLPRRM